MSKQQHQAILFELLRSFTTLARTLNLSQAVRELNSTRQTVRRHISILEEAKGESLFTLNERQYELTEAGRHSLQEAQDILARGGAWLQSQAGHVNGLFHIAFDGDDHTPEGYFYHLQQHPISRIWQGSSNLISDCVKQWAKAGGELDHEAFAEVRPHALMFRDHGEEWLCTEVGSKSAYAEWFGDAWARSSVGRPLGGLPGGSNFASLLSQSFDEIRATHGLRYDHVFTQIVHGDDEKYRNVGYERLLMGCRYPDESLVLVSVVHRNENLDISGVSKERIEGALKEFETN